MNDYRILLIEDSAEDVSLCRDTIKRMNRIDKSTQIDLLVAEDYESAIDLIEDNINGLIIDIKLRTDKSGNDLSEYLIENIRVPAIVFTGTPDVTDLVSGKIPVFKKGEITYEEIINNLISVHETGLFKVLGYKGSVEDALNDIFWDYLYPKSSTWASWEISKEEKEKVILRHALSYLHEKLDEEVEFYLRDEMYIIPPMRDHFQTGSITIRKSDNKCFVVLSPACDMAFRNEDYKTDSIKVCEIEDFNSIISIVLVGMTNAGKKKKKIKDCIKNNYTEYYHWLPSVEGVSGGFMNFRKVITLTKDRLHEEFNLPCAKIQELFMKDIVSRYSSYYARQGQPDFHFDNETEKLYGILTNPLAN